MKTYTFQIVIEKEPNDPGYWAHSPTLPGCFGAGATVEEARASMRAAIEQHLSVLVEEGYPIPASRAAPTAP